MATVYEKNLMASLSREVGDTDSTNYYYTANQLFSALNDGIQDFNEEMPQQYEVVSSGDDAYYNPDPDSIDQRLIILYSARALLRGELAKQAREAIVHTNAAGRTDMTARPEATDTALQRYDKMIARIKLQREKKLVQNEMYNKGSGEELRSNGTTWVEGLPITTIETTV